MAEPSLVLSPTASCVAEASGDDFLVLDTATGRYFGLGEVGGWIWSRLDGRRDLRTVAAEVAERYAIPEARAATDVAALADQLLERGLVAPVEPGG